MKLFQTQKNSFSFGPIKSLHQFQEESPHFITRQLHFEALIWTKELYKYISVWSHIYKFHTSVQSGALLMIQDAHELWWTNVHLQNRHSYKLTWMYKLADAFQFAGDAAYGTGSQSHHESSTKKWFCFRINFSNILTHISEDEAFSEIV